ncbi:MAG: bifunctional oligoribonuclease/PAP phosphatase NrnA [Bacteroidia bacterium]|nr:bifunctional oligoribonuclease/PAP phosphatase NrnA [Bacteroidia bacterium]
MNSATASLAQRLSSSRRIVIVTHMNPDGDAMGSSLGLANHLSEAGHFATVIAPNEYPEFLAWLPGQELVKVFSIEKELCRKRMMDAEIIFCLDFNTLSRIGEAGEAVKASPAFKVLIDHHEQPETFAELLFHDVKACSTAQLVFDLIEGMGEKERISKNTGMCLYTGIMTDTASFRFPSTSAHTHAIAGYIKEIGVETWLAHEQVYDGNSYNRLRLTGYALSEKMKILKEVNCAYITLTKEELQRFGFRMGDTEGLVNYALSVRGMRLAAFFMEKENEVKISLRSKGNIDVNQLARKYFSGGGHRNAAGGNMKTTLAQAVELFEKVVQDPSQFQQ